MSGQKAHKSDKKISNRVIKKIIKRTLGTGCALLPLTALLSLSLTSAGAQTMPTVTNPAPAMPTKVPQAANPVIVPKDDTLPVKPPPFPTGVIPLPQGAPPTGRQSSVPTAVQPLPRADQPLKTSPQLSSVNGYVQDRAITLQEAVAIALYANRNFAAAVASLQQAEGRTGQARTALNPTLSTGAEITEFDAPTTANLGAFAGGGQAGTGATGGTTTSGSSSSFLIVPQFNPVLTTTLGLPLDVSGALRSAVSQVQFLEVAARIDVNRVRNDVVYNVKNAFYNVLRSQAQRGIATDSLNNALRRLEDANKNYAAGTAPRFDVISAQRDVANAQQDLINARAQISVNLAALKSTIGLGLQTHLRLSDQNAVEYPPGVLPPTVPSIGSDGRPAGTESNPVNSSLTVPPIETPAPMPAPPLDVAQRTPLPTGSRITTLVIPSAGIVEDDFDFGPDYEALLQEAMKTRPEILEGDAQIAAARRGIQYARRSTLPSVNLSLSNTFTPNYAGFTRENVGAATLGVTIPIFDGGLARARVKEAHGVAAGAEVNRRQSVDQVQIDVQQAYIALVQGRSRVAVSNVGLAQAREAFRLARVRYTAGVSQQAGVSPQLELSNAQTTLAQAQSNQINALYDFNSARAQLDRAVGRYSFTATAPGYPAPPSASIRGVSR